MKFFLGAGLAVSTIAGTALSAPANADNTRLNWSVLSNVYSVHVQADCTGDVTPSRQLVLAAQWHTDDVLNNRALDGDFGSDGTSVQDRANAAGYHGRAQETVAINPAMAISGIEIMHQWYDRPDYLAVMSDCANSQIGVWSDSTLDRTVVVAVYGAPAR